MKINVADIQKEIILAQDFEGELAFQDISWQGERLSTNGPLRVKGNIANSGKVLILTADVSGSINLQCGSCTKIYEQSLDFSFEAELKKAEGEEDPDYFLYQGDEVDLRDIVLEFLLLRLPIRRRCSEGCKGLCPECGINLNDQTCECSNNEEKDPDDAIDERLLTLKDYFSTQTKEV